MIALTFAIVFAVVIGHRHRHRHLPHQFVDCRVFFLFLLSSSIIVVIFDCRVNVVIILAVYIATVGCHVNCFFALSSLSVVVIVNRVVIDNRCHRPSLSPSTIIVNVVVILAVYIATVGCRVNSFFALSSLSVVVIVNRVVIDNRCHRPPLLLSLSSLPLLSYYRCDELCCRRKLLIVIFFNIRRRCVVGDQFMNVYDLRCNNTLLMQRK